MLLGSPSETVYNKYIDFAVASTKYSVPSFLGHSYIELKKLSNVNRGVAIEMEFSTSNNEGILLYSAQHQIGRGDFISLTIKDGHVVFRYLCHC